MARNPQATSEVAHQQRQVRPVVWIAAAVALAVLAPYAQVRQHQFTNYDDHRYVTRNWRVMEGLTLDNIAWAFTTFEVGNWHPLTWISHMLDVSIFGFNNPGGHHLVNVLLHAANAVLVLVLLHRMTGSLWRSAAVAAIFALHPLRVESVAWVSERKDVLSVFFGLLAIHAYLSYVQRPSLGKYAVIVGVFACSLLSKPMLVTLPAVLLLLDYWPLKRLGLSSFDQMLRIVIEKVPLVIMSIASAIITIAAQISGGSVSGIDAVPVASRFANAAFAYGMYLKQTIWPVGLAPLYPLPETWPVMMVVGSVAALVVISVIVVVFSRKRPAVLVGWLWFLGTLVPVIGLVQVGSQSHADRYTYFPHIGLLMMVVWSLPAASNRAMKAAYAIIAVIICVALGVFTFRQTSHWRDSVALSEHTLRVTTNNTYAHFNLGNALMEAGRMPEAIEQFQIAAALKPRWADAPYNLGNAYMQISRYDEAVKSFDEALRRAPKHVAAMTNRGIALAKQGQLEESIGSLQRALEIDPQNESALVNLGQTLARANRLDEAVAQFERALAVNPNNPMAHLMLGNALARMDRVDLALPHFTDSLRLDPGNPHAHMSMAAALAETGWIEQALAHLRAAGQLAQAAGDETLQREIASRIERYQRAITPAP